MIRETFSLPKRYKQKFKASSEGFSTGNSCTPSSNFPRTIETSNFFYITRLGSEKYFGVF